MLRLFLPQRLLFILLAIAVLVIFVLGIFAARLGFTHGTSFVALTKF